jgi:hypothetical protein
MFLREKKRGKTRCSLLSRSRGVERVFESERVYLSLSPCAPRYRPHPLCLRGKLEKTSLHFSQKTSKKYSKKKKKKKKKKRYGDIIYTNTQTDRAITFSLSLSFSLTRYARARERSEITPRDAVLLRARLLQRLLVVFWYFGSKRELVFYFFVVLSTRFVAAAKTAAGAKRSVF